jgi:hypothetical protein
MGKRGVGELEGRKLFGRPRHRYEDNVKMDLQIIGWGAWTGFIWRRIQRNGRLV